MTTISMFVPLIAIFVFHSVLLFSCATGTNVSTTTPTPTTNLIPDVSMATSLNVSSGLPGPRGRKGLSGTPGTPGVPGITAYKVNGNETNQILIPPKLSRQEAESSTILVQEGDNVRIPCVAEGSPTPKISWRRDDNRPIVIGQWSNAEIEGSPLNITRVRRDHFGDYICTANNGIPPIAQHRTRLEVTFSPTIKVPQQMIGTSNGSSIVLKCVIESYPPALNYWIQGESKIIENNWKYKISNEEEGTYTNKMVLNISYVEPNDYSMYKCAAKNEKGTTFGLLTLYEIDPNRPKNTINVIPGLNGHDQTVVYGENALLPEPEPCPACPDCPVLPRCPKGYNLYDAVRAIPVTGPHHNRSTWVPMTVRRKHCILNQVGKPVYYRDASDEYGSWMQDADPRTPEDANKYFMTMSSDPGTLFEFSSKEAFRNKNIGKFYQLPFKFDGNSHVLMGNNFYYNQFGTNKLIKFNLVNNETNHRVFEDASHKPYNHTLYETQHNYMDICSDENGVWVIYASNFTNNTLIVKINYDNLKTENVWNLTLDNTMMGEMFIACGVLYGLESTSDTFTKIRFAFDLYLNTPIEVSVNFTNPFKNNNLISYNPRSEQIYAWDAKNLIEYPIRFIDEDKIRGTDGGDAKDDEGGD